MLSQGPFGGRHTRDPGIRLDRPFLHAARLSFDHPVTGRPIVVEEPLPPELAEVLDGLREGTGA